MIFGVVCRVAIKLFFLLSLSNLDCRNGNALSIYLWHKQPKEETNFHKAENRTFNLTLQAFNSLAHSPPKIQFQPLIMKVSSSLLGFKILGESINESEHWFGSFVASNTNPARVTSSHSTAQARVRNELSSWVKALTNIMCFLLVDP